MVTTIYIKKDDEKIWKAFVKKHKYKIGFSNKLLQLVKQDLNQKS